MGNPARGFPLQQRHPRTSSDFGDQPAPHWDGIDIAPCRPTVAVNQQLMMTAPVGFEIQQLETRCITGRAYPFYRLQVTKQTCASIVCVGRTHTVPHSGEGLFAQEVAVAGRINPI